MLTFDCQCFLVEYQVLIVRFLILQTVISQDVNKKNFIFVPDLGKYEGNYCDEELCKKWNINKEEWQLIDSKILPANDQ